MKFILLMALVIAASAMKKCNFTKTLGTRMGHVGMIYTTGDSQFHMKCRNIILKKPDCTSYPVCTIQITKFVLGVIPVEKVSAYYNDTRLPMILGR